MQRIKIIFEQAANFKVLLSKKTFFYEKCALAKNSTFILGMDTFARLIDLKYYNNSYEE